MSWKQEPDTYWKRYNRIGVVVEEGRKGTSDWWNFCQGLVNFGVIDGRYEALDRPVGVSCFCWSRGLFDSAIKSHLVFDLC